MLQPVTYSNSKYVMESLENISTAQQTLFLQRKDFFSQFCRFYMDSVDIISKHFNEN